MRALRVYTKGLDHYQFVGRGARIKNAHKVSPANALADD